MACFSEGVARVVVCDEGIVHSIAGRGGAACGSVAIEADEGIGASVSGTASEEANTVVTDLSSVAQAWCTNRTHTDFLVAEAVHIRAVFGTITGWETGTIEAGFASGARDAVAFAIDEVDASVLPAALASLTLAITHTVVEADAPEAGFLAALCNGAEVSISRCAEVVVPAGIWRGAGGE